ncbi:hypothetical protein TCDM_12576 [Trypanosoma cruzi Dm28c]|uniref:Uncharacterized protein n=1 Tax=Trypanosoma cruzi Dm28c TaxID=1416333 RepID=V5CKL5_TRYCR|nr:hypothetical protein TCDM_12576 [Trypanosoma cruzi Dm28c]
MEGQTVEAHVTIFLILFSDKICRQFLEQHGSWVLFVWFFFFFIFVCSRNRGRHFSFFLFFFSSLQSVRCGRVRMNFFKF